MHWIVVMEGQRKYVDEYVTYLLNKQHVTQVPNIPGFMAQPNVREIRFFDISNFESTEPQLLRDLAPYDSGTGDFKNRITLIFNMIRKGLGLEKVNKSLSKRDVSNPVWRDYINVKVIGKKKDIWKNGFEMV